MWRETDAGAQEYIRGKIVMVMRGPRIPAAAVSYAQKVKNVQDVRLCVLLFSDVFKHGFCKCSLLVERHVLDWEKSIWHCYIRTILQHKQVLM